MYENLNKYYFLILNRSLDYINPVIKKINNIKTYKYFVLISLKLLQVKHIIKYIKKSKKVLILIFYLFMIRRESRFSPNIFLIF